MKTDPQNSDYVVESGAARNFEPWRDEDEATENEKRKRESEEMGDAMKSLENRAMDSKQDMDILAALEEMRSMKSRHATVSVDDMLATLKRSAYEKEKRIMEEIDKVDEEVIKTIIFPGSKDFVRRIEDDEDEDLDADLHQPSFSLNQSSDSNSEGRSTTGAPSVMGKPTDALTKASIFNSSKNGENPGGSSILKPKFILKPRSTTDGPPHKKQAIEPIANSQSKNEEESKNDLAGGSQTANGLLSLCQNYDSDDDSD